MKKGLSALVVAALLAGAGSAALASPLTPDPGRGGKARKAASGASCTARSYRGLRTTRYAYAAIVRRSARAYGRPDGRPFASFERINVNGVSTVFGVLGAVVDRHCRPLWYRVQLPLKPNGRLGYVRPWTVSLWPVRTRIVVDLSDRRVRLYRSGRPVLETRAAIGTTATPTPRGHYYVNQRLVPSDPSGPFGPGAIGISAFSEVLTGWTQGGPIAIHGTNRPYLIGGAVSNGCIRVRNDALRRMFAAADAGTPVVIRA
ncbi:MAG: L,D-transpeptidase [Actinobacteria bacterium]|nr:L,D-transpeptidase [Actinomycetota bacterium]